MSKNKEKSIVNDGIEEVLNFLKKISKTQKAQKATLFIDIFLCKKSTKRNFLHPRCFMHTKIAKITRRKALLFRCFMRIKMLSFLFAYVRFALFILFFLLDVFMRV